MSARLIVELDGSQHSESVDAERTAFLERQGFKVLRFWDNDVLLQTDAVLEAIVNALPALPLTPTPLPMGEGLQSDPL
jgi:very-short-patch-repair endonuclease